MILNDFKMFEEQFKMFSHFIKEANLLYIYQMIEFGHLSTDDILPMADYRYINPYKPGVLFMGHGQTE